MQAGWGHASSPLVYEDSYGKGEVFPHIYGSLNLDAIIHIFEFPANDDGMFSLPDDFHDKCRQLEETASRIEAEQVLPFPNQAFL